jgi:hypothetical protein
MINVRMARPLVNVSLATVLAVTLMSPTSSYAQSGENKAETGETEDLPLDERAINKLKAMADVLKAAKSMKILAISFFDEVEESGIKNKRFIRHAVSLQRPDKLRFTSTFDNGDVREGYYNGKHLIMANPREKTFVRLEIEGNVDTLLDTLHEKYEMSPPIADLLYSDVFSAQKPYILSGAYLGGRKLGDLEMDHLAFESPGTEWQVWLQKKGQPLPVRMLIRFVEHEAEPEYMMTFLDWELNSITDNDLAFAISPDWELRPSAMAK